MVVRGFPRKWAIAFYAVLLTATAAVMYWIYANRHQVQPLSTAEAQDLVAVDQVDGKWLKHPTLGFALRHPGPKFFASREAEEKIGYGDDPSSRFQVYTELDTGRMIIVALSRRPGMDGAGFAAAVDSIARIYLHKTAAGFDREAPVETLQQEVDPERRTAAIHTRIDGKAHLRIEARASRLTGDTDYLLVLITLSPADDSLAPISASLIATPTR